MITLNNILRIFYQKMGFPKNKMLVMDNCVDISIFNRIKENKKQLRKKLGIPQDEMIILYSGSLKKDKGIKTILESAKFLENKNYSFYFVGGTKKEVKFWQKYVDEVSYLDYREEQPKDNHRGKKCNFACAFLWQRLTILCDGTVLPCLVHGVKDISEMILGTMPNASLKQLWQSEKLNKIRQLHIEGKSHLISACDECSDRALIIKKIRNKQ